MFSRQKARKIALSRMSIVAEESEAVSKCFASFSVRPLRVIPRTHTQRLNRQACREGTGMDLSSLPTLGETPSR